MILRAVLILQLMASYGVAAQEVVLDTEIFQSTVGETGLISPIEIGSVMVDFDNEIFLASIMNPYSYPVTVSGVLILYSGCCIAAVEGGKTWATGELIAQAPPGESFQHLASFETISTLMDWREAEGVFQLKSATIILYDAFEDKGDRD